MAYLGLYIIGVALSIFWCKHLLRQEDGNRLFQISFPDGPPDNLELIFFLLSLLWPAFLALIVGAFAIGLVFMAISWMFPSED